MKTTLFSLVRRAGIASSAALIFAGVPARAADKAQADAFPNFDSYIKITGQAASVSGNEAAFQSRAKQPSDGGVGIEDLHLSKDLSKTTTLTVDGKALTGSEDYLAKFNVTKTEVGSVEAGYKRFRTFYDGAGGFFPLNNQWMTLTNEDLHVDRAKFWLEAKLALKDMPEFEVKYTNELRDGRKDSTIWGSTDFTGLPLTVAPNPVSEIRKIAPSYLNIGERHENLEASVRHTIKKTTIQFSVEGDRTNNNDTRFVTNFPGQVIPFAITQISTTVPAGQVANPQVIAKAILPAAAWNNEVKIAETDASKTQTTGANASVDSILTDKLTLRVNANYDLVHTTVGGGRPLITQTPTATGVVPVATDNYANLYGGTRVKDYTGNIALDWKAAKDLFFKFAFRAQSEFIRGTSGYNVIAASGTPALTLASTPRFGWAKIHQNVRTPVLEFRYTGIKDLAIYFNGSKRDLSGVETNTSSYNPLTAVVGTPAANNVSEDHGNYTLGANWKTSNQLTLRAEVFHKGHKDNTVGFGTGAILGDYYLLDSKYSGYKLTALAKPIPELGFTTRFVSQHGTMKVTGFLPTYPAYDSLNSHNYTLSETIDFNPNPLCYAQIAASAIYNVISTAYPRAGVTPATVSTAGLVTASAFDTNKVLQNSNNNYITLMALTGWVVDKNTDAQLQLDYYRANNANAGLYVYTTPYGVAVEDTTITLGVKHKFSDKWVARGKVGYFQSTNDGTGGHTNYRGPVAFVSIDHAL